MRVEVLKPFRAGETLLVRGDVVAADDWGNLPRLLSVQYVREAEAEEVAEKSKPRRRRRSKKQDSDNG